MRKVALIFLSLILVVIMLGFVSAAGNETTQSCTDSDGGLNYYMRGSLSFTHCQGVLCGVWADSCIDSTILLEYSCSNANGERYTCPHGCVDGACISICKKEGEKITAENWDAKCCEGLTMIGDPSLYSSDCSFMITLPNYVCTNCGNEVCGIGESKCNCLDCRGETTPAVIDAYLNQKFELRQGQGAIIKDYKNMKVNYISTPDCTCPTCAGGNCACSCQLGIKLQVDMPSGGDTGLGTQFNLGVGEKKQVFDVTLSLIDLSKGVAVLLVSKENCPEECICTDQTISCPVNSNLTKRGFMNVYFQCYDGEESKSTEREACKTAEFWKKFADNFCQSHCGAVKCKEGEMCPEIAICGVNSFSLSNECDIGENTPGSTTSTENGTMTPAQECKIDSDCPQYQNLCGDPTGPNYQSCVERTATASKYTCINGKCIIPGQTESEATSDKIPALTCKDSCPLDGKCYPFGYRKDGKFCSDEGGFTTQKSEESCQNNFECSSNVCVSGKCVSEGLIQKIISWFKRLFGGE